MGIRLVDQERLCTQMSVMLGAGLPVIRVLSILRDQAANPRLRNALEQVRGAISGGATLGEACRQQENFFGALLVKMVQSGEVSGNLDAALLHLAEYYRWARSLRTTFFSRALYPAFLLVVGYAIVAFVSSVSGGGGASGLARNLPIPIGALILAAWFMARFRRNPRVARLIWGLPLVGRLWKMLAWTRFGFVTNMMMTGAMPIGDVVQFAAKSTANPVFEAAIEEKTMPKLRAGEGLAESLAAAQVLPQEFLETVAAGEVSGTTKEMLQRYVGELGEMTAVAWRRTVFTLTWAIYLSLVAIFGLYIVRWWVEYFQVFRVPGL